MSFDGASAAARRGREAQRGGSTDRRTPPVIRVDDEDAAAKLTPSDAADSVTWIHGDERRRSMPANHSRFVDEPYVFSLSQALAMSSRRRSEPFMDASAETREFCGSSGGGGSPASPRRHLVADQTASSGKPISAETWDVVGGERRSSVGAIPKTTANTTTMADLDELSSLQPSARTSHESQDTVEEQMMRTTGSRFLSLPQPSDYLSVPARRHSVALIQPTTSRMLDVIAEETVSTDSKNLASSRRYSLSCHVNT